MILSALALLRTENEKTKTQKEDGFALEN
jgi:hypothetical protein